MNRTRGVIIASAAATLIIAGATNLRADAQATDRNGDDAVMCSGVNDCAGKGTCAGTSNGCAGMNSCKGKGVVEVPTPKDCICKGGKIVDDDTSKSH